MPYIKYMEKAVYKIIKIGKVEFMDSFLMKGEMYFNTVDSFMKEDENQERFDDHEGADDIEQVNWIKLQSESGDVFEYSKTNPSMIKLSSAYALTHIDLKKGNIYSCSAVTPDTLESFRKLDSRFKKLGDTLILIKKPKIFFERVEQELNRKKYEYEMGLVHYYNPKKVNGPLLVFNKKKSLSYQNEARIWIKNDSSGPIKIYIGPIKDIAVKIRVNDLIEIQKYDV